MSKPVTLANGLRAYPIDGKLYYGITSILGASGSEHGANIMAAWKERVGQEEADRIGREASIRGTAIHKWAEEYLQGKEPALDEPLAIPYWKSILPVLDEITNVRFQEKRVYHPVYGYAGTLDCYATFRGVENTLIDFKTSAKAKRFDWIEHYCIQTVAYSAAVKACHGLTTNQTAIIIARPEKTYKSVDKAPKVTEAQVFTLCREEMIYYWDLWLERLKVFNERMSAA